MEQQRFGSPFPPVMVFAGTDPSGGAGLTADILTLASMGCHPLAIPTALTVQDTLRVEHFQAVDAELVADQARFILEDMEVAAFKIGVIGSVDNVTAIAEVVGDYPHIPLIVDPVLASGGGDEFAQEDMIAAMRELLLPVATIITPNSHEARRLLDDDEAHDWGLDRVAEALRELGSEYVLITGTHEATPTVVNTLYGHGNYQYINIP